MLKLIALVAFACAFAEFDRWGPVVKAAGVKAN